MDLNLKMSTTNRRMEFLGLILDSVLGCMFLLVDYSESFRLQSNCSCSASGPPCGLASRFWILWCPSQLSHNAQSAEGSPFHRDASKASLDYQSGPERRPPSYGVFLFPAL